MLGGIIGDLAASTYLRDPNCFYRQLIDDKATLSEYGLSIIISCALRTGNDGETIPENSAVEIRDKYFRDSDYKPVSLSREAQELKTHNLFPWSVVSTGMMLNAIATNAFFSEADDAISNSPGFATNWEKDEGYARQFISRIIYHLRQGKTKNEVYEILGEAFSSMRKTWAWHEEDTPVCLVLRAWDCFYNSHDFGSAIHNAVRYPNSFTRQIASLVGLMAEAMYGCGYYFIKEKFAQNGQTRFEIEIPKAIYEAYPKELKAINKGYRETRLFFRKNDALTNVERHSFMPCKSRYEGLLLSPESHQKALYAFHTGWEDRFGFYLDNGWVYCYRSGYILGRLRFEKQDMRFKVCDVQRTEEIPEGMTLDECLGCAFYSCRIPETRM